MESSRSYPAKRKIKKIFYSTYCMPCCRFQRTVAGTTYAKHRTERIYLYFRVRHDVSLICFENIGSAPSAPLRDKMRRGMRKSLTYSGLKNGEGKIVIA